MQFKLPQALALSLAATQVSANLDAANIMDALTSLSASATELAEQASHADLGELAKQLIGQYSDILHSPLVHLQSAKRDLFPFLGIGHDVTASDPDSPVVQTAQSNRPSFVNNLSDTVHNIPDITADMSNADASGSNTVVDMTPNTPPVSAAKWAAAFTSLFAEISKMLSSTINGAMQTRPTKRGLPTDLCAELNDFVTSHQTLISKITTGNVSNSKHLSDAFGALLAEFSHEVGSFEQLLSLVNPTCATAAKAQLDALKQDAANASKVLSQ